MNKTVDRSGTAARSDAAKPSAMLARITHTVSRRVRWAVSATIALIAPLAFVAESASASIAEAVACFGNGPFMALAAGANALTLIP